MKSYSKFLRDEMTPEMMEQLTKLVFQKTGIMIDKNSFSEKKTSIGFMHQYYNELEFRRIINECLEELEYV